MFGITLYKTLHPGLRPCLGGHGTWAAPGQWNHVDGALKPGRNGLHVCWLGQLIYWLGPEIWEVEIGDERIDQWDKIVVREARLLRPVEGWDARAARSFAADCAERALPIWEREYPDDPRPRRAVRAARRFAEGQISLNALLDAADAATRASHHARCAPASDAAEAAFWAAYRTAGVAARGAARQAALATRGERARHDERRWQTERLMQVLDLGWRGPGSWIATDWPEGRLH